MAIQRYVNLNKTSVNLPSPSGQPTTIHPFREALDDRARRPDALYVVEGEFWSRYMNGTPTSALQRFPLPRSFARDSFPALPVYHCDGRKDDGAEFTDGSERAQVAAAATPGRYRAAGDVITPSGMIRRRNPLTGEDEEVPDIPANRNVLKPLNAPGEDPEQLRRSIIDYMTEKGVTTVEQFDALSDAELGKIPGMHPLAIPRLRENLRTFLTTQGEKADIAPIKTPAPKQSVKQPPKPERKVKARPKAKPKR